MPGVMVTRGVQQRIPPGGLVISLSGPSPPLVVELRLEVWLHWLALAVRAEQEAFAARLRLRQARTAGDQENAGRALESELQAGMQLACASAFALDAIFDSTKTRLPPGLLPEWAWRQNHTSRPARIVETMRVASAMGPEEVQRAKQNVNIIFKWRDWAVHPEAAFKEPQWYPAADASVEWHFVAFRCENGRNILSAVLRLLGAFWSSARAKHPEILEWSAFCLGELSKLQADRSPWLSCAPVARQ